MLQNLPEELICHIFSFLDNTVDIVNSSIVCKKLNKVVGNNNFNSTYYVTSNSSIEEEKCKNIIGKLILHIMYDENTNILNYISDKLHTLTIDDNDKEYIFLPKTIDTITLNYCSKIKHLEFDRCKNFYAKLCSSLRSIKINNTLDSLTIDNCRLLSLDNIRVKEKLVIKNINIENLSIAMNVKNVSLYGLDILSDISNLRYTEIINISHCYRINDISFLKMCKEIYLRDLLITNISVLKICNKVTLIKCDNISDISSLENVKDVSIYDCDNIRDFSKLGKQKRLVIQSSHLKYINNLKDVKELSLIKCINIENFDDLGNQDILNLIDLNIKSIDNLINVRDLSICSCKYLDFSILNSCVY